MKGRQQDAFIAAKSGMFPVNRVGRCVVMFDAKIYSFCGVSEIIFPRRSTPAASNTLRNISSIKSIVNRPFFCVKARIVACRNEGKNPDVLIFIPIS